MTTPQRIQLRRTKGWRKPEGAVVVSRPSKWGNHYAVSGGSEAGEWIVWERSSGDLCSRHLTRREAHKDAVLRFTEDARRDLLPGGFMSELVTALSGRDLCCWCPEDLDCHADVLLELANGNTQ